MSKYLVLNFRNAGLFRKHGRTKDKIYDITGVRNRKDMQEYVEPITVHQISNMLHVLFGERPKPINRVTVYDRVDYYYEKALESYLKIDAIKNKKGKFYSETIHLNKPFYNSWNPVSHMNWNRVNKLLETEELITKFFDTVNEVLCYDVLTKTFYDFKDNILKVNDVRLDELFAFLKTKGKTSLHSTIYTEASESAINMNGRTMITQTNGLDKLTRLNGQIIVPITDDDVEKLRLNKGSATLLDGGLVYIKGIKSGNSLNVDGFTKISQISLEKQ